MAKFRYTGDHWKPEAVRKRMLADLPLPDALRLCESEANLRALAMLRGFKSGWVFYRLQEGYGVPAVQPQRRRQQRDDDDDDAAFLPGCGVSRMVEYERHHHHSVLERAEEGRRLLAAGIPISAG